MSLSLGQHYRAFHEALEKWARICEKTRGIQLHRLQGGHGSWRGAADEVCRALDEHETPVLTWVEPLGIDTTPLIRLLEARDWDFMRQREWLTLLLGGWRCLERAGLRCRAARGGAQAGPPPWCEEDVAEQQDVVLKLLAYLWPRRPRVAVDDALARAVWGESLVDLNLKPQAIKSATYKATRFLGPYSLTLTRGRKDKRLVLE
jgi:hypothetical protein